MRGKRKRITILMAAAMLGILAGCTPDSSKDSTKEVQKTEAEQETERNEKPEEGQEPLLCLFQPFDIAGSLITGLI